MFLKDSNATGDASFPKLMPDQIMDAGTVALFDFSKPFAWGGTLPADGAALSLSAAPKNYALTEDGFASTPAALTYAFTYQNRGIQFSGTKNRLINLPDFKINWDEAQPHFAICLWIMADPPMPNGITNEIYVDPFGGNTNDRNFQLQPSGDGSNLVSDLYIRVPGLPWQITDMVAPIFDDELHQIVMEYETIATQFRLNLWLDGALVKQSPWTNKPTGTTPSGYWFNEPTGATSVTESVYIGARNINAGGTFQGGVWRAWKEDLNLTARPLSEMVALDYTLNAPRLTSYLT